ncbi:hypothetical protein TrVE_jg3484 [Triparma verrucosa]|uniref:VASt domain-containing protein n=1 Tax=Triparma verrucosa TaxID=1606542 RepID=A0A9W7ENA0_9STRA|nr:hypothetical protein TrVE_jg3484 [Triparma verrucosa]
MSSSSSSSPFSSLPSSQLNLISLFLATFPPTTPPSYKLPQIRPSEEGKTITTCPMLMPEETSKSLVRKYEVSTTGAKGSLWITKTRVCYYSNIFGFEKKLTLHYPTNPFTDSSSPSPPPSPDNYILLGLTHTSSSITFFTFPENSITFKSSSKTLKDDVVTSLVQHLTGTVYKAILKIIVKEGEEDTSISESLSESNKSTYHEAVVSGYSENRFRPIPNTCKGRIVGVRIGVVEGDILEGIGGGEEEDMHEGEENEGEENTEVNQPIVNPPIDINTPNDPTPLTLSDPNLSLKYNVYPTPQSIPSKIPTVFSKFISDSAEFNLLAYHTRLGDESITITPWSDYKREINFTCKTGSPIGPEKSRAIKSQTIKIHPNGFKVTTETRLLDVPNGDAFYVTECFCVIEDGDDRIFILDGFEVNFVKSTMFKSIIERKTKEETRKWVKKYVDYWRECLGVGGGGGEEEEVEDDKEVGVWEWIKDEKHLFQVLIFLHGCVMGILVVGVFRLGGEVKGLEGKVLEVMRALEEQRGQCGNVE